MTDTAIAVARRDAEIPFATVPAVPSWNENYCWTAFDPIHRVSIYIHNGRWPRERTLWHDLLLVCVAGRQCYMRRNIGPLAAPEEVGTGCLRMHCDSAFERWRWRYLGPVIGARTEELVRGQPADTDTLLAKLDLSWESTGPVIDFGHGTEPGALASHYEQGGRLRGQIELDGVGYELNAVSFRDHSRGPRELQNSFDGHFWMHATFPSGRSISSLIVARPSGELGLGDLFCVGPEGAIEVAKFDAPHELLPDHRTDLASPFVVKASRGQHRIRIAVEPQFWYPTSLAAPSDLYIGQSNDFDAWRIFQLPVRLEWEGETTFGHLELGLSKARSRSYGGGLRGADHPEADPIRSPPRDQS